MAHENRKIKIGENKNNRNEAAPHYFLSYEPSKKQEQMQMDSYRILSVLKGESPVIIELDSSLLNLPQSQREDYSLLFLKSVKAMELEYRYRKAPSSGGQSLLSQIFGFGGKPREAYNILVYIPDNVWKQPGFQMFIPSYGCKYHVLKPQTDGIKALDDLHNGKILDFERFDFFSMLAFDCGIFGQAGLYTSNLSLKDLQDRFESFSL